MHIVRTRKMHYGVKLGDIVEIGYHGDDPDYSHPGVVVKFDTHNKTARVYDTFHEDTFDIDLRCSQYTIGNIHKMPVRWLHETGYGNYHDAGRRYVMFVRAF